MTKEKIGTSIHTCRKFDTLDLAIDHARRHSTLDDVRYVIHTGDHFFSSTTAQIFWYEKLLFTYRSGVRVETNVDELLKIPNSII